MAEATRLIPQSTVDLPTSHFDFDFSSFDHGTKQGNLHTPYRSVFQGYGSCGTECTAKDCTCDAHSLLERRTEDTTREDAHPIARHYILKWPWQYFHHEHSNTPISSHSCKSISNTTKSNVSSVPDLTTCTTSSTPRSLNPWPENRPSSSLLSLSSAILNQILSYALTVPLIIPIGHELHDIMQIPGRNAHTTLRQSLDCPLFLVSHSIRNRALDVFFSKNIFIVDLAAIYDSSASYTDLQIKRLHKFWITETPAMVQLSLRRVSRLILRLPVPSTEAAVRRGREEQNWMDGSDGHGGGGYRMKSLKEEVEDSLIIQKCLRSIVRMVLAPERESTAPSTSSSRLGRLRRSKSTRGTKSNEGGERRALKLLEIILVKRSSRAMVLREVLGLVHLLKDIQVGGILRICFELNGRKTVWATKRKETWEDRISNTEPDGAKLLHDLQYLRTWRPVNIEPITSPTEFKYVSLSNEGMLFISPTALRHTTLGNDDAITPATPRPRTGLAGQKPRTDSFAFIMAQGISLLGEFATPSEKGFGLEAEGDKGADEQVGSRKSGKVI